MTNLPDFFFNPEILLTDNYLTLDFETTIDPSPSALEPMADTVLACWRYKGEDKHSWGGVFSHQELLEDISKADLIVAHFTKFELQWLKRMGVDLRKIVPACTFLAEWVLNGNLKVDMRLDTLAYKYLGEGKLSLVSTLINRGVCPSNIGRHILKDYCAIDVDRTERIFKIQREVIVERDLLHIWHVRNLASAVLADVEFSGMTLDKERVFAEDRRVAERLVECERTLTDLAGGINLRSGLQVAEFLYDKLGFSELKHRGQPIRTPGGRRKADASTIAALIPNTEEQRTFVETYKEFNNLSSLRSKNLNFFVGVCNERNGVFHASLNQGRTATHRLASSGIPIVFRGEKQAKSVQFQNLPRPYKRFICAPEGYLIGEADEGQLEFRVAVDLSKDPVGIEEILNEVDVHTNTVKAYADFGVIITRQDAKPLTFKPTFGGRGSNPADRHYCQFFRKKYQGLDREQHRWVREVLSTKKLRTALGMIYYWPDAKIDGRGYCSDETSIFNYPIQGTATAEIMMIALISFWHRIAGTSITLINTIHDSIISIFKPEDEELYKECTRLSMTRDVLDYLHEVYEYDFTVPLAAGVKIGTHWGESKVETIYEDSLDGAYKRTRVKT